MSNPSKCSTNNANFEITISRWLVKGKVELPFPLEIDETEAEALETLIHNQLELILRPYFDNPPTLPEEAPLGVTGYKMYEWYKQCPPSDLANKIVFNSIPKLAKKIDSLIRDFREDINFQTIAGLAGEREALEYCLESLCYWFDDYVEEELLEPLSGKACANYNDLLNVDHTDVISALLGTTESALEHYFDY